jgi:hypothetical protein
MKLINKGLNVMMLGEEFNRKIAAKVGTIGIFWSDLSI